MSSPVFCAVDTTDLAKAEKLAASIKGRVHGLKLGLEFFMALGEAGYKAIAKTGVPIFLDVKLHDIPNTVAGAMAALLHLKPVFITIHTSGGPAMMRAAADAAAKAGAGRPKLLGVTVLTSLDAKDLAAVGQDTHTNDQVLRLAKLAKDNGLDGVVCSPAEVEVLRKALGPDFILMVPGIRPSWAAAGDQKRVMTPKEAMTAGATYMVIGRPITGAEDPAGAAEKIAAEIA
ncbi:MAG TPA: orotidine-5'-phosphate decarboxylase [Alphaproteobacteria bacterium]|nr:orotidine-5'-phosphate decarboxylase [Alphaproteobacteria bacterium]